MIDCLGIDLDRVKQFAAEFKSVRLSLGLTQTQVRENERTEDRVGGGILRLNGRGWG